MGDGEEVEYRMSKWWKTNDGHVSRPVMIDNIKIRNLQCPKEMITLDLLRPTSFFPRGIVPLNKQINK